MSATPELIAELRRQFNAKLESGIPGLEGDLHPDDTERVKDDQWLKKFLDHQEYDMAMSLQMLTDTCVWRKAFGTNDIDETNIRMDYMTEALFYPRGKDIDGCTVFIFNSKKHYKGQRNSDDLKRCVIYWFEHIIRLKETRRISIFFDMDGTGLSNMDMDFTRYLISLFKMYYPDFLNYILIYEMPWVLTAAFKVIKQLLPPKAVAKMKFLSKANVKDYIPIEHMQKSWGGNDDYVYSFVTKTNLTNNVSASNELSNKKVHFADPGSPNQEAAPVSNGFKNRISLIPNDCIVFTKETNDMVGSFTIINNDSSPISFKIKTTSPEKFKVRPSLGTLDSGEKQKIFLTLWEGYQFPAIVKEKFLIMCLPIESTNITAEELSELWKDTSNSSIENHRLRCSLSSMDKINKSDAGSSNSSEIVFSSSNPEYDAVLNRLSSTIKDLRTNQVAFDSQLSNLITVQLLNLLLSAVLLCIFICYFMMSSQKEEGEFCSRP